MEVWKKVYFFFKFQLCERALVALNYKKLQQQVSQHFVLMRRKNENADKILIFFCSLDKLYM